MAASRLSEAFSRPMGAIPQSHLKQKKTVKDLIVELLNPCCWVSLLACTGRWPLHFTVLSWYQEVAAWGAQHIKSYRKLNTPKAVLGFGLMMPVLLISLDNFSFVVLVVGLYLLRFHQKTNAVPDLAA